MQYRLFYLLVILLCNTSFSPLPSDKSFVKREMGTIPFVTTWKTDNPGTSDDNTILIATSPFQTYNYTVDWGDGSPTTNHTGDAIHTYTTVGTYTVSITGLFPAINNGAGDPEKLVSIEQWGNNAWADMSSAFDGCTNMVGNFADVPDLSNVTNMASMFADCSLFNSDINNWDVSNVTNMSSLFRLASAFDSPIGNWDTSNVTSFSGMFYSALAFNQDIGNWNTSSAVSISRMFFGTAAFNQDINFKAGAGIPSGDAWDTSNVIDMQGVFWNAQAFNQPIGDWDTGNATNMSSFFNNSPAFNQDIGSWDMTSVLYAHQFFAGASAFNQDISGWNMSGVQTISIMFGGAAAFNQDIGGWDIGNATSLSQMFSGATSFNQDISGWDVSNVTNMYYAFNSASSFDQNLGAWNVENVTDASSMFRNVTLSNANYDALLIGWNAQNLQPNVTFNGGNSQYCGGETARTNMALADSWTISDGGVNCPAPAFVTTWQTDNPGVSNNDQITIPTTGGGYNYTVDWGDGNITTGETGNAIHTYATPGTYTVSITGDFPRIFFNGGGDREKLVTIEQWGNNAWSSMSAAFSGCINLVGNFTDAPDLSNVTDMSFMLQQCTLFNSPINNWDVGNVTRMNNLFNEADSFNQDIGNWNTSNVTTMSQMFYGTDVFNQNIGNWNTSNVTDMFLMFFGTSAFNQDISFKPGSGIPAGDAWNTANVTNMSGMFWGAAVFNENISNWDLGNVTSTSSMFQSAPAFDQNIGAWDMSNVINVGQMFQAATAFNQDIGLWNTANILNFALMFQNASSFNQDIGAWDVSSATDMERMFFIATNFNQDLSLWDVEEVIDADRMLDRTALSTVNYDALLIGWNAQNLQPNVPFGVGTTEYCAGEAARTNMMSTDSWTITDGGLGCPIPGFITTWQTDNPGVSNNDQITIPTTGGGYNYNVDWGDGNITTGETGNATHTYATPGTYTVVITGNFPRIYFANTTTDREKILTIEQWGDNQWTSMVAAFSGCSNLQGNFSDSPDLSNVTRMRSMFAQASIFNHPIGDWDVSTITDMGLAFQQAFRFNQDISNWDVSAVNDFGAMFNGAYDFNQDIGIWNVSSATSMSNMFGSAHSFNQDIGNWNVSNVNTMQSMFGDARVFDQDISRWDVGTVTNMRYMFGRATDFNQDISSWNVGAVTTMQEMFYRATSFDQNIGGWNVTNTSNATGMFDFVTLSLANYDALLIGWNGQNLQPNVTFSGGDSQYCAGEAARTNMMSSDGWTITDGGLGAAPTVDDLVDQNHAGSYILPAITGTNLTGTEGYYTDTNGGGTAFDAGDTIYYGDFSSYPVTLYRYDGSSSCSNEEDFQLTLTRVGPEVTITASQEAKCDTETTTITLTAMITPAIATGTYSYSWNIQGNPAVLGTNATLDVSPNATTIYEVTVTDDGLALGSDTGTDDQTITVGNTPQIDQMADVDACTSYTLPIITGTYLSGYEVYSDDWAGAGNIYPAGSTINFADYPSYPITLYVYDENEAPSYVCPNEMEFSFTLTNTPTADDLAAITECTSYTLPALSAGNNYFSETNGGGTPLNAGEMITTSQRLYIYTEAGTAPNACSDETILEVTIVGNSTADNPADVTSCETYILPDLPPNNSYYTDSDATGTLLNAGDVITASQTIYVYSGATGCSDENSFLVTIDAIVTVDSIEDATECENYTLPLLTNGNYFSASGGQGSELFAGDTITATQTIYVYFELGTCSDEGSFEVNIDPSLCEEAPEDSCQVVFPKFFSPNSDGNNDVFQVMENPCGTQGVLTIYDRYGKLLARHDISGGGWDGNFQGKLLPESDYWYQFVTTENGEVSTGHFSLKR
ncbi:BspA family leucine-rich repeat surface protein [Maribacter sp.]|nr:BspA family leucine-rich repeat surface protein [Maribacter sp.]